MSRRRRRWNRRRRGFVGERRRAGSGGDGIDACAAERRVAAERCGLAVGARVRATEASELLRTAQRTYDDHMTAADAAAKVADSRAVRREKEAAQARFRAAYNGSKSTEEAEAAARDWLVGINDVNSAARTAAITAKRERAAATAIGTRLERLTLEADAARIAAEAAEAACLVARQALAECDERVAARSRRAAAAGARGANGRRARSTTTSRWRRPCRPGSRRRSSGSCAAIASR